ncbi:ABC transporter ATP-binding protein [Roseospirillum parvum]|uniref:ABC-2 type transport system ATP-binding protein n=1 Tax=Roseospirillum parvum TaxID=83401 RepID=A0A1G7VBD9_9PROT|nr:ABC transporter ATP-binding protein [Roseospirillum parvum]SDG57053.1 ABC-2 type transport system ATP-binding protein [Roseospirillum parvum]
MIEIDNVVFDYPGLRALDGVSCTLPAGRVTALVGPNGAGKTTLMRCIAGLERPLAGRIRVDGIDVALAPRKVHARLGFLYDFYGHYEDLTVAQALRYRVAAQGVPKAERADKVALAIHRLGLGQRAGQPAATLSRGWRQKAAIALAIVHDPQVVMLDEPASGLDPEARGDLSALILDLNRAGKTLLVSSHILAELADYSSHVLVLRDGHAAPLRPVLDDEAAPGGETLVEVRLASPLADWAAVLSALPAPPRLIAAEPTRATLAAPPDAAGRAALLAGLIGQGLAVSAFAPARADLAAAYQAALRPTPSPATPPATDSGEARP